MVLHDDAGVRFEDHDGKCHVVQDYFRKFFTEREDTTDLLNVDSPRVFSADQNAQLVREFTFAEFTVAIKQMHLDKASGPDGLNPFFRVFWNWSF